MKLAFEAGPGYAWTKRGDANSDFLTLRFAERFEHQFTETSKFWQSAAFTLEAADFSNYHLDLDVGIETRLSDQWSLRTFVRHRTDASPAAGSERADTCQLLRKRADAAA
jgi:hypothetical protein